MKKFISTIMIIVTAVATVAIAISAVALGWFMLISKEAVSQFVYFQF